MPSIVLDRQTSVDNTTTLTFAPNFRNSEEYLDTEYVVVNAEPSATPAGGTLDVQVRYDGFTAWQSVGTIDLTAAKAKEFTVTGVDAVRTVPSGFDAGKTYDARVWIKDR